MIEEALKSAKKVVGAKQTAKAVEKDRVAMVYLASDADERVLRPIREVCSQKGVKVETVPTMAELGRACGIDVGAAAIALLK